MKEKEITLTLKEESIVKSLIADHLRSMKLLTGLESIGFEVLDHYLGLPETIFKLMNIEECETIFRYYVAFVELKSTQGEAFNTAADEIYEDLVWMREEFQRFSKN